MHVTQLFTRHLIIHNKGSILGVTKYNRTTLKAHPNPKPYSFIHTLVVKNFYKCKKDLLLPGQVL